MKKLKIGWQKLGFVGVDSGQLLVCDPCYIDGQWKEEEYTDGGKAKHDFSYNSCCHKVDAGWQLNFNKGAAGIGVVFPSGLGDGCYDVWGEAINIGTKKKPDIRLSQIRIILLTDKEMNAWASLTKKR